MVQEDACSFAAEIARVLQDYKSEDVVVLDLRGISTITDCTVIATGTSERQIRAAVDYLIEMAKKRGQRPFGVAGYEVARWVVVDFVDVVVHVFSPKYRDYYDLELLWGDAARLDWAPPEGAGRQSRASQGAKL